MEFRRFPPRVEDLGRQWVSGPAVANLDWRAGVARFGGTLKAFDVYCAVASGVAKPGSRNVDPAHHAVAAHEKICSDLAYHLGLPVPPATLWVRKDAPPGHSTLVVVSAHPFEVVYPWRQIAGSSLAVHFVQGLSLAASAMAVFDTWVSNPDRFNDGNLLVSATRSAAYIDFANALSLRWGENGYQAPNVVGCYPGVTADLKVMSYMVTAIGTLPDKTIRGIVDRIPQRFLQERDRRLIIEGLLYRKPNLRKYMQQQFPGIP